MENTLIRFMGLAVSAFVLVLGISMFLSLNSSFFSVKSSVNEFELIEGEVFEEPVYNKADIYYDYSQYANDENIIGLAENDYGKVAVVVDDITLDYKKGEEEVLKDINKLAYSSFKKKITYSGDKLTSIIYESE